MFPQHRATIHGMMAREPFSRWWTGLEAGDRFVLSLIGYCAIVVAIMTLWRLWSGA